jgi:hypothetical protein
MMKMKIRMMRIASMTLVHKTVTKMDLGQIIVIRIQTRKKKKA